MLMVLSNLLRKNKIALVLLASVLVTFSSCKKDDDTPDIDLGYDFFPNVIGTYREYAVDSIYHGITEESFSFFRREELTENFIDGDGQVAIRVERFKKNNIDDEWVLTDIWTQKRTTTTAERFEENQRYVRLAFPVNATQSWDGNAYNTMEEWQHSYSAIGAAKLVGQFSFGTTLTVNQRNNVNLVDQEIAKEIYAKGVGLVYKSFKDLNFQNFEVTGVELEMTLIDHGYIE